MDAEDKFWFGIWSLIAGLIAIIAICITVGYAYNNSIEVAALSKATNPQAYACALLTTNGASASERCAIMAQSQK